MSQSKRHNMLESVAIINMTIVPLILNTEVSIGDNLTLTGMFTVASLIRSDLGFAPLPTPTQMIGWQTALQAAAADIESIG